ncbi:MAG: helix-turn-helix transcriptional regulator [Lachnospiraceae bacterium]|nr:helix-turn-helix transcriptional regulator [Lachnospiraceae bacterium]
MRRDIRKTRNVPKVKHLKIASEEYYDKVEVFTSEICRRLREARLQANVSISELARATGLTDAAIYKYEKNQRISMPTFARVMFALQLELDVIPFFDSDMTLGREFEYIVQELDPEMQTKILNEVRAIVGLVKHANR